MSYSEVNYADVEPDAPDMHFLRDALDCEHLGVTVIDAADGKEGMEHDHEDRNHEEVYLLIEGEGSLTVDGDVVDLSSGDAVRVAPESTRRIRLDADSLVVVAGAP